MKTICSSARAERPLSVAGELSRTVLELQLVKTGIKQRNAPISLIWRLFKDRFMKPFKLEAERLPGFFVVKLCGEANSNGLMKISEVSWLLLCLTKIQIHEMTRTQFAPHLEKHLTTGGLATEQQSLSRIRGVNGASQ